ncbi:MAG: hypothetical protein CVV42_08435 [Candidatus Riflebacteria bacterium HGW-Riflebacteria-2]|nr:MAG: hypothetical protein CVV42_08435 [Candidatus Riflebacteria bacterium HGW-Riflebacteria-2]
MKNLAFDEIVRNLLVYLKGQVPSLSSKDAKDDVLRQVQSMTFTIRSTIVQLEGAAFQDPRNTEDYMKLEHEIESLKATNAKLEESLFLEMNKTSDTSEKFLNYQEELVKKQRTEAALIEEIDKLKKNIEELAERPTPVLSQSSSVDESVYEDLKADVADLESRLAQGEETISQLRQALQNKEIELSKSKEALMDAMKMDKSEIETLKRQLAEISAARNENSILRTRVSELEAELSRLPSADAYRNNIAASEAKISYLEKALIDAQSDAKRLRNELNVANPEENIREKEALQQRIVDLEATLRSVIKARDANTKTERFSFAPEECVYLFETLATTASRLAQSPENRDVYARARDSIAILEKSNAIQRIHTIGETFDGKVHKAAKSFKNDFLPDNIIIKEEGPGFVSGNRLIQKAVVWVGKSVFNCTECFNTCRPHEYFCPKCGLELTAPDGTSKRDMPPHPVELEPNILLLDKLIDQGNLKAASGLLNYISREYPGNVELAKRQALLSSAEKTFVTLDN